MLVPGRPPSLTYWGLGVMLELYARHGLYISGDWRRVAADDILRGTYYFYNECSSYNIQNTTKQ